MSKKNLPVILPEGLDLFPPARQLLIPLRITHRAEDALGLVFLKQPRQ